MAEKYLAEHPSAPCKLCNRVTARTDGHCAQCWTLRQVLTAYVPLLLADPAVAPKVRELLERALTTPPAPEAA